MDLLDLLGTQTACTFLSKGLLRFPGPHLITIVRPEISCGPSSCPVHMLTAEVTPCPLLASSSQDVRRDSYLGNTRPSPTAHYCTGMHMPSHGYLPPLAEHTLSCGKACSIGHPHYITSTIETDVVPTTTSPRAQCTALISQGVPPHATPRHPAALTRQLHPIYPSHPTR